MAVDKVGWAAAGAAGSGGLPAVGGGKLAEPGKELAFLLCGDRVGP